MLYNFVDNHDVNRVASQLKNQQHLSPLYALLFSMPGIPSIYYGSEWGVTGQRSAYSDQALRPALNLQQLIQHAPEVSLPATIQKLAQFRAITPALQTGSYRQAHVSSQQFAFWRETDKQKVLVVLNSASNVFTFSGIRIPNNLQLKSVFENQSDFQLDRNQLEVCILPHWVSLFVFE
jgi:glycosidase